MREYFTANHIRVALHIEKREIQHEFWIENIEFKLNSGWHLLLSGKDDAEFITSVGLANATQLEGSKDDRTGMHRRLGHKKRFRQKVTLK